MAQAGSDHYAMGRSSSERERLSYQDRVYGPHSEHFLRCAGLAEGMRVLDVGCGTGTTSRLIARLVGTRGHVLGIDEDAAALEAAREAAAGAGLRNVQFSVSAIEDLALDQPVDALFGRLILMHLDDPAAALKHLAAFVRPGGIVSFQEPNLSRARSVPEVPLWTQMMGWTMAGLTHAGRLVDAGDRLPVIFRSAGLPTPALAAVSVAGDADSPAPDFVLRAVRSLAPLTVASGAAKAGDIEGLGLESVIAQARERQAMLYIPELVAAWVTMPQSPS